MAVQLIADLYGCNDIADDMEEIKKAAHIAIEYVGAHIVEECIHKFELPLTVPRRMSWIAHCSENLARDILIS